MLLQGFSSICGLAMRVLMAVYGTALAPSNAVGASSEPMSKAPIGQFSAMHDAVRRDDAARVRELLAGGTNVNERDALGRVPLHYASRLGDIEMVQLLLNARAQIDAPDKDGFTPLMRAVQGGHTAIVALLLHHGAGTEARTNTGASALDIAIAKGDSEMIRQLQSLGAPKGGTPRPDPSDSEAPAIGRRSGQL
jgi:uncharacterized protein